MKHDEQPAPGAMLACIAVVAVCTALAALILAFWVLPRQPEDSLLCLLISFFWCAMLARLFIPHDG